MQRVSDASVPITLVRRRDVARHKSPTLVMAYGAYGVCLDYSMPLVLIIMR